jgi:hypothetical protein
MRPLALLLCAPFVLAEDGTPEKPVLVHADAACFVHALRAAPDTSAGRFERVVAAGRALVHTVRATGEMTVLVPPTGVVAISTRRASFKVERILGVAADKERLYVLSWTGRAWDRPPAPDAPLAEGRHALRVFWLADGEALKTPVLDAAGLPKEAGPETLEKGPLRLIETGVECFGTRASYRGRELQP